MSEDDKKKVVGSDSSFVSLLDKIVVVNPLPEIVIKEEPMTKSSGLIFANTPSQVGAK